MNINYHKIAFDISVDWHFRDGIPEEWHEMETDEEFQQAFDAMPKMIDDCELIVEEHLKDYQTESVVNTVWNLYRYIRISLGNALRECE